MIMRSEVHRYAPARGVTIVCIQAPSSDISIASVVSRKEFATLQFCEQSLAD